ncbi:MAG TPA: hypothetical protein DCR10_11170 [Acidimicrobiaceae bacterium]|nr:hypothetical protein [Acidimicrobiaceae bacterium]|tara:strand:+ start:627 stop:1451 length:825 start_codon:yes stop_codon:yes gene_type:complete
MCTTGALRIHDGSYLLFKNKDFGRPSFEDKLFVSRDCFGVCGTSSWAEADSSGDEFSGFSIGANSHGLFCADSNVREEPSEGRNYDELTEIALTEGTDVESAIEAVQRAQERDSYWCANLVLADPSCVATIEIRGTDLHYSIASDRVTRTNHHVHFGAEATDHDRVTTENRLAWSTERLSAAAGLPDILELQQSHDGGASGICNHTAYQTVYSYILIGSSDGTRLIVKQGHPCEEGTAADLLLPLGTHWSPDAAATFQNSFPSSQASPIATEDP